MFVLFLNFEAIISSAFYIMANLDKDSDSEDSEPEDLKAVDGGKMSKKTRKEVKALIN